MLLLLLVAMAAPTMAQVTVGVEVGDWFQYEAKVLNWDSDMEFLPEGYLGPLTLAENETNWIKYTVTDVVDENVTFLVTYDWKNGSTTDETVTLDVDPSVNQDIFMIGANMTEGDMVSDTFDFLNLGMFQYPARYITSTEDLENPNATRETNVLIYPINILGADYNYTFWWDRATGMRVYYYNEGDVPTIGEQLPYSYAVEWRLVDSSVDGLLIPDLTGPILLLTIMSITVPVALLHRRRKRVI